MQGHESIKLSHVLMGIYNREMCINTQHNTMPSLFISNGLTPHVSTFGTQGDISRICNFRWYEWIYYQDHGSFPIMKEKLGRALGPLRNEGNEMAQAILTSKGIIIPCHAVRKL